MKLVVGMLAVLLLCASQASASISPLAFGVNSGRPALGVEALNPAGVGLVRRQAIEGDLAPIGSALDPIARALAANHLTWYPMLGIPPSRKTSSAAGDAGVVATFAAAFAHRYGRGGTFWTSNPSVPYEPVGAYEIGNEPNVPLVGVADETNLHYGTPGEFATVYSKAYAAIHAVDPSAQVIVGGLAPYPLESDEAWLHTFLHSSGPVDAVGWHPYFAPSLAPGGISTENAMQAWTQALRDTLNNNGHGTASLDLNEFDSDAIDAGSSAAWGSWVAAFTRWAMCTPSLGVSRVIPEWWGGVTRADSNPLLPMAHDNGALTDYGRAFLDEAARLTSSGCPGASLPSSPGPRPAGQLPSQFTPPGVAPPELVTHYNWRLARVLERRLAGRHTVIGFFCAKACGKALSITPNRGYSPYSTETVRLYGQPVGRYADDSQPDQCADVAALKKLGTPLVIAGQAGGRACPGAYMAREYYPRHRGCSYTLRGMGPPPRARGYILPRRFSWPGCRPPTRGQRARLLRRVERRHPRLILWY